MRTHSHQRQIRKITQILQNHQGDTQTHKTHNRIETQNSIYLVTYCKNTKIERKITKLKNRIKIKTTDDYNENMKYILMDREDYKILKDVFLSDVDPLRPEMTTPPSGRI